MRRDVETWLNAAVPEDFAWTHTLEGADDMPAHVKASLMGPSLTLPIARGRLALGTWQGIYLCEHRDRGGPRSLLVTLNGEPVSADRAASAPAGGAVALGAELADVGGHVAAQAERRRRRAARAR